MQLRNLFKFMQQDSPSIYYMVLDEKSTGPYTLDEITLHPALTPETLVWKPGIDNWVAAKTLPELAPAFVKHQEHFHQQTPPEYNTGNQGPQSNPFADNPQYQQNHTYYNHNNYNNNRHYDRFNGYGNGYRPNIRTNWLPWAIVATVLGFFASCIGAIFGIIGIIQANKANTLYAQGFDREGDAANSNAKIMTIIGLIFAAIGIIALLWFGSTFNVMSNYSYF